MSRTLVIGLDGSSWNVLDPLLEAGRMPNLQALRERGASGPLESSLPFYTGPAWASYATGASPAAHGIWDFMMVREGDAMTVAHESDLRRRTYYELLADQGRRSVLINLVLDQEEHEGVTIVNSWLTEDGERRLFPASARERYRSELDDYVSYPTTFDDPLDVHLSDLQHLEETHMALARRLFEDEEWDHFYILFSSPDWLGHHGTGAFAQGDPAAIEAFGRLYAQLDSYIGWFVERAGGATVVVLSDHGQCEETHVVRVNQILRGLGHVKLRRERPTEATAAMTATEGGTRATVRVPGALTKLKRTRIGKPLARFVKRVLRRGFKVELVTPGQGGDVDRVLSRAFSPTVASFAVYLHEDVTPEELEAVRAALLEPVLPDGRPAIDGVWTVEELYGQPAPPGGPALFFSPALNVIPSIHVREPVIDDTPRRGRGCHQREGMIVIAGPQVEQVELSGATIYDLAPTLLWLMGEGVPAEGDGRVLFEAFDADFAAAQEYVEVPVAAIERDARASGDEAEVVARLQALGYL